MKPSTADGTKTYQLSTDDVEEIAIINISDDRATTAVKPSTAGGTKHISSTDDVEETSDYLY